MKHLCILFSMAIVFSIAEAQSIGGAVSGSDTVCSSSNSGALTLSGHTGNVIRWQSSADGGNSWSNISNTTVSLNYSNITTTTMYRAVVQQGANPTANSSPATITVDLPSSGTVGPDVTVCAGSNTGSLNLSGMFTGINHWEYSANGGASWNSIPDSASSLSYSNLAATMWYRANITNGTCPAAYSSPAVITVSPHSVGGSISGSVSVCSGSNSGMLNLGGQTGNVVRWQYSADEGTSWSNISNATASYNFTNLASSTRYRAVVQSGACPADNSAEAAVTVFPASDGGQVNGSATVCSGINAGTLELTNYTGAIVHWEKSTDNGSNWTTLADTTDTLRYLNLTVKTVYRAIVQSGSCAAKRSESATISVSAVSAGGVVSGADSVCSGTNSGALTLGGYTGSIVRWQSSDDGGFSWSNLSNNSSVLNYTNLAKTTLYRAVVQNGTCPAADSKEAEISVFPVSAGGTVNSDATVCSGLNQGTLVLSGYIGNPAQWEYSVNSGGSWNVIANSTDTLRYSHLIANTLFRALVQSRGCPAKYSSVAAITVNAPSAGGNVTGSDTVCPGSNSGSLALTGYRGDILKWQRSDDGGVTWINISNTTAFYNYANITSATRYRAVVQQEGCPADNSLPAIISVYPVSIGGNLSPANCSVCSGGNSGSILLDGNSGAILYWETSVDGGVTWDTIGNTSSTLSFKDLAVTTKYRTVVQSGPCAADRSDVSTVTVFPRTVGGMVQKDDTVCTESNSGSLTLAGFTGNILNWEKSVNGGVSWTGISNSSYVQNFTNLNATTQYRAVVQSGTCLAANSAPARISVSMPSVGGSVMGSATVCDTSGTGTLTLNGNTGTVVNWEKSTDNGNSWTPVSYTGSTLLYSGITGTTLYRAMVESGACPAVPSNPAAISLTAPVQAGFQTKMQGPTVIFTNTSLSAHGASFWEFGDSTTSTIASPAHTYIKNGSFLVTLTVTDSCGMDTAVRVVVINGLGIDETVYQNQDILVYPNPFSTEVSVAFQNAGLNAEGYEFILCNVLGQPVKIWSFEAKSLQTLERGDLPDGIYIYKVIERSSNRLAGTGKVAVRK